MTELNTGRTYAPMKELVTTTDGKCPAGYIEVDASPMLAPGLAELLRQTTADLANVRAINRNLTDCMIEAQDLIRQYKEELARLRAESQSAKPGVT